MQYFRGISNIISEFLMSAEAPKPLELTLETEEEERKRLGVETAPESPEEQETSVGITSGEIRGKTNERAQEAQQQTDQEELARVRERLSQGAQKPVVESSQVRPAQPSEEEMRKMQEESFLNAFSQTRSPDETTRLVKDRNQKRPLWKKALFLGRTTPENLQKKEEQEGADYINCINKGDFMGAVELRNRNVTNKIVAGEPGTNLLSQRFAEGYKYATPQQIAEALTVIHPDAIAQYPKNFKEHPAVKKEVLKYINPEQFVGMGFSDFSDRVKKYEQNGLISREDVEKIYSSRSIQREIQQTFESLLGPNSVMGSKESREMAPKRLAEFLEAGAITQKQSETLRRKYKF